MPSPRPLPIAHALLGTVALFCIATFWSATLVSELWFGPAEIAAVKRAILGAMSILIPAMMLTGLSGTRLAQGWQLVPGSRLYAKQRRMKLIAINGALILLPSAWFLARQSSAGQFDTLFYAVQSLELLAGAVNLTLLLGNLRDGLALRRSAH